MPTVKNVRPGWLILGDLRIKLAPGQTIELGEVSKQTEKAMRLGHLVDTAAPQAVPTTATITGAAPIPDNTPPPDTGEDDRKFSELTVEEALARIAKETSMPRLRAWLTHETRPEVQEAMRKRIAEVKDATA